MNILKMIFVAGILAVPIATNANIGVEYKQSSKTANQFCLKNKECVDVVAMELDALYYQGLNEPRSTTIGTLINRKDRSLLDYCQHTGASIKDSCEEYKNQLMLKYIMGLLDR